MYSTKKSTRCSSILGYVSNIILFVRHLLVFPFIEYNVQNMYVPHSHSVQKHLSKDLFYISKSLIIQDFVRLWLEILIFGKNYYKKNIGL